MPITGLEDELREEALRILTEAAEAVAVDLIEAAPVDTGELVASAYGPEIDEVELTATVGFDAPQADYTNEGVLPHGIDAVNADKMVFFWENGPNGPGVYFFEHVDHPGQEGTHWFDDIVDAWDDYVESAAAT